MDQSVNHDQVLQQWMADEAAVRARLLASGVSRPDQVRGRTGLQMMEAMLAGELPPPPIAETLDFGLVSVAFGEAIFQGKPQRRHYNPMGSVHGGWYATLLDSALGCAVHTTMPVGRGYTTLEFKVNLVRALNEKVPLVRAIGRVVHGGKQVATAEADLVGHDGRLYAHASTTCLVFDLPQG
ncbi:PaaI family thioesterase [Pelomonas sp. V22]|uniref:PaaI family thioesterase n=1 Tax=Pelomonas sp. V22 TaxID=2822139 RepID=UPI0024A90E3B|nr:PaaI family thioesterase [Pelomonas sp. V22]MDI4631490.1 PaaI family thioesterase [Pelomonas sp. V22]